MPVGAMYEICYGPRRVHVTCSGSELEWTLRNLLLCQMAVHSVAFVSPPATSEGFLGRAFVPEVA